MTDVARPRGRGWKILGIVVGVMLACVGGLLLWISAVAGRKVEQMDAKTKAMIAEWHARDATRPVLRGTATPGNAWDDYNPALAEIKKTKDMSRLGLLVSRDPKGDPEFGRTTLAAHAKTLDLLRQGAGRATSRFAYDWESGAAMQSPPMLVAQHLANLATLHARALAEAGKPREAVGVLLDLGQFGRDMGDDGTLIAEMIGAAGVGLALMEARDLMKAGRLDAASLGELEAGLSVLDGSLPRHGRVLSNEVIFSGMMLRDQAAAANFAVARLLFANAFERITDWYGRAAKMDEMSWAETQKLLLAIGQESASCWNPMCRELMGSLNGTSVVERQRRVQIRFLRIAARYKATGELPDLEDPFGAKLKTDLSGGALKIWSVGKDGVDDGGVGVWDPKDKDMVLDLGK